MLTRSRVISLMEQELESQDLWTDEWIMHGSIMTKEPNAVFRSHPSMGCKSTEIVIPPDEHGAKAMIRRHVTALRRLELRDSDMRAAGCDVTSPPPWSHLASTLGMTILRNITVTPLSLGAYARSMASGMPGGHESVLTGLSNDEYDMRGIIRGTHARIARIEGRGLKITENATTMRIALDVEMPETILIDAEGRALSEVIAHPALSGIDDAVAAAENVDGRTTLSVRVRHVAVDAPPAHCSKEWQRIDLHRSGTGSTHDLLPHGQDGG